MGRVRVAVCIGDAEYQARFIRCLMNHYKERFELHSFDAILQIENPERFDGYILGRRILPDEPIAGLDIEKALILDEENQYIGINHLMEEFEKVADVPKKERLGKKDTAFRVIGVHSFGAPQLQMPFVAVLAEMYGENTKTVVLDFQRNSGLDLLEVPDDTSLGMEEFMATASTNADRRIYVSAMLGHCKTWDYIHPVKNSNCLQELTIAIFARMLSLLTEEMGYQTIVVNLGEQFVDFATICQELYLLQEKSDAAGWREKSFIAEMERREKDVFFNRIKRIEVPSIYGTDKDWTQVAEQWKWNPVGKLLQSVAWEESGHG